MDTPIATLEHLHCMVPQPFTYYTAYVEKRRSPCSKKTTFYEQLLLLLLNGAFTLFFSLVFSKREMDYLGGFCGVFVLFFVGGWRRLSVWLGFFKE